MHLFSTLLHSLLTLFFLISQLNLEVLLFNGKVLSSYILPEKVQLQESEDKRTALVAVAEDEEHLVTLIIIDPLVLPVFV